MDSSDTLIPEDQTIKFLLVDDDEDHAHIVMRTIERERILNKVFRAENGAVAMRMLRKEGQYADQPRPDIVLLDLKMPIMDGHEVLSAIRSDPGLRKLPVVVMTTSDAEADRARAYELNANSYLVKPLDFSKLRQLVKDLSLYWGVWNRPAPESGSN